MRISDGSSDVCSSDLGDPNLVLRVRTTMLAQWRREARRRLPELSQLVDQRHALMGELAHASVPDLKESLGGLRDATVKTGRASRRERGCQYGYVPVVAVAVNNK